MAETMCSGFCRKAATAETVMRMITLARDLPIAQPVVDYVARLVMATHPVSEFAALRYTANSTSAATASTNKSVVAVTPE